MPIEGGERTRLTQKAGWYGYVLSPDEKHVALTHSTATVPEDLFVMPNHHVEGDLEGFGITLIEAAARGLPSIASRTDGIPDAVIEGRTGYLVPEGDAEVFAERIRSCRLARDEVRSATEAAFSWADLARRYAAVLRGGE